MKILYFDCTNGISGDMVLSSLAELAGCSDEVMNAVAEEKFSESGPDHDHEHGREHDHGREHGDAHEHHHAHVHGRSYGDVKHLISSSTFSDVAKTYAANIYSYIADAEASVHGASLATVHFHEVGRDQAIKNALGIGMALEKLAPDAIYTSPIYDGRGTVICSHGEIPVPVPAVAAMMEKSSFVFETAPVDTEMVTPSGLASLLGIGAEPFTARTAEDGIPEGNVLSMVEAKGSRDTGRDGLKVYLIEG